MLKIPQMYQESTASIKTYDCILEYLLTNAKECSYWVLVVNCVEHACKEHE